MKAGMNNIRREVHKLGKKKRKREREKSQREAEMKQRSDERR